MIYSRYFYDVLDCLLGQFLNNNYAECVEKEFGINISSSAKEYFSIAVISEELQNDLAVIGILLDDSAHRASRNGFTFTIYIDLRRFTGLAHKICVLLITAHEICHFAFYYELFIRLGDNTGIRCHSDFTHAVSSKLIGAVTNEQDITSQTVFEEHDIQSLLRNLGNFSKDHFSKGQETDIDYKAFLDDFLKHIKIETLLDQYFAGRTP
jgi:hypothetical protein